MAMGMGSYSTPFSELMGHEVSIASSDGEESTASGTYVKLKQFTISAPENGIDFKVVFQMKNDDGASNVRVQIKVNGANIGPEIITETINYVDKEQELTGINNGDTIELWGRVAIGAGTIFVRNFRVKGVKTYLLPSFADTSP